MDNKAFELLEKMYIKMQEMEQNMATKSDLENVCSEVKGMKSEMEGIKSEVKGMKSEMEGIKSEVKGIKFDMKDMKSEMKGMKSDISDIKGSVNSINEQTAHLTEFETETKSTFKKILKDLDFLTHKEFKNEQEIYELKKEIM